MIYNIVIMVEFAPTTTPEIPEADISPESLADLRPLSSLGGLALVESVAVAPVNTNTTYTEAGIDALEAYANQHSAGERSLPDPSPGTPYEPSSPTWGMRPPVAEGPVAINSKQLADLLTLQEYQLMQNDQPIKGMLAFPDPFLRPPPSKFYR